jgi:hypothetical protein
MMGRNVLNFNWDAIDHDSVVLISASEYNLDNTPNHHRFVGAADVTVLNISPMGHHLTQTMEFSLFFKSTGSHRSTS